MVPKPEHELHVEGQPKEVEDKAEPEDEKEGPLEEPPEDLSSTEIPTPKTFDPNELVTMATLREVVSQIFRDIGSVARSGQHAGQCIERLAQLKAEEMAAVWEGNRDKSILLPENIVSAKRLELQRKTLQFIFNGDMEAMNDVIKQIDDAMEDKEKNAQVSKIIIAGR